MTIFAMLDPFRANALTAVLVAAGLTLVWRGLRGGTEGTQGLVGARTPMLGRIEGFRLLVFGLVLIGVGLAVFWQAQWLLVLALGIGFVEILESSVLIAVWKRRG
jgi:hypothetical protein